MSEVIQYPGVTTVSEPAEAILEKAKKWDCEDILVIGINGEGELQFGGNVADMERISWLLTLATEQFRASVRNAANME